MEPQRHQCTECDKTYAQRKKLLFHKEKQITASNEDMNNNALATAMCSFCHEIFSSKSAGYHTAQEHFDEEPGHTGLDHSQCGPCEARFVQTRAVHWCTSCEEGLCSECCEYHKAIKASRDHSTITVQKFEALKPFITSLKAQCDDHESLVTLYCPNHEVPCCSTCVIENHAACLGITSFQEFAYKLRKSNYIENLDTTIQRFLQNIDCIIGNRKANKDRLLKQEDDRSSTLTKIRENINDYLDELERQLILKSDGLFKEDKLCVDTVLKCLQKKRKNVLHLKENFDELRQNGTDAQVFYGGKKLLDTVKEEEDSLLSLFEGPDVIETSLEFHIDPMLKENILKTADVYLNKEKSIVSLTLSQKPSCQIVSCDLSKDVLKVKAVLMTQYDTSKLRNGKRAGCILMLPTGEIIACDFGGRQLLVFTSDGNVKYTFEMKNKPFGLAYLGKKRLAVSFPESEKLLILRTEDYSCENEIILDGPCWGLAFSDGLLIASFKRTNMLLLDISGNVQRNFPMVNEDLVYVHKQRNNLYRADYENSSVHCYDQQGKQQWQFKSSDAIGTRSMCTDSNGNLFVACKNSNCVVLISKDGNNHKVLFPFNKPKGLCYDAKNCIIYVCSCDGRYLSSFRLSNNVEI